MTGFGPSPRREADPSAAVLAALQESPTEGATVRTQLVPQEPEGALLKAIEAMDRLLPDAVIGLGRADDGAGLSVERVALNFYDQDRSRRVLRGSPIDAAGPAAYFSTLPVHLMVERMRSGGVPAQISNSAGTFLCNRLFYALLHYVALRGQETWFGRRPPAGLMSRIGFIRLPASSGAISARGAARSVDQAQAALRGVHLAIESVVDFLATIEVQVAETPPAGD